MRDDLTEGPFHEETDNVIYNALVECGEDHDRENGAEPDDHSIHRFLANTPTVVFVAKLRLKLKALGCEINFTPETEMAQK